MAFVSRKKWLFSYFSQQLGDADWHGKYVLDFGGNIGNILRDPYSTIDEEHYWCIDVDKEALEMGKQFAPKSHWVFYDRYSFFFNPHGVPHLPLPDVGQDFDYIVAYSVFTNTLRTDMLELVDALRALLKPNGALAFTFIDPHYSRFPTVLQKTNLQWRIMEDRDPERTVNVQALMKKARDAHWCILVNGADLYIETEDLKPYEPDQQRSCITFYSATYMQTLYPKATVRPPVNNEMQHCCILRND